MNEIPAEFKKHINEFYPLLEIKSLRQDPDGLANDVFIVNEELVFRFPKNEEGRKSLRKEAKLLTIVRRHVDISVPFFEKQTDDFVVYHFLDGQPLYNHELLKLESSIQDQLAEQLATFLLQLHSIPITELEQVGISISEDVDQKAYYLNKLEEIRADIYPHLWKDQRIWIEQLFKPLLDGKLNMNEYQRGLTHNDLASCHILYHPKTQNINAVLDFGESGIGDMADDFKLVINSYGESFLEKMSRFNPRINEYVDRARFMAGVLELDWVLNGVRSKNIEWFLVHIGRSRDIKPIGTKFSSTHR